MIHDATHSLLRCRGAGSFSLALLFAVGCSDFGDPSAPSPSAQITPASQPTSETPPDEPPPAQSPDGGTSRPDVFSPTREASVSNPPTPEAGPDAPPMEPPESCSVTYASGPSHCIVDADQASCAHLEATIGGRLVYYQTPMGTPPAAGWPVVVIYQGSIYGPSVTWTADSTMPFGGLNQAKLQAMLLDNGFMVVAPPADGIAWYTNFPGYETSPDATFIPLLISDIKSGKLGPADSSRLYATGISSGGYMTSRMAVTYAGTFRALAIESGSYMTCSNVLCLIPDPLPADHPPTLFLHGQNDIAVPIATAQAYVTQLQKQGLETQILIDPNVGHQWLAIAPEAITCWFRSH